MEIILNWYDYGLLFFLMLYLYWWLKAERKIKRLQKMKFDLFPYHLWVNGELFGKFKTYKDAENAKNSLCMCLNFKETSIESSLERG